MRKISSKKQIKHLDKLAKPVIVFVNDHPEVESKNAFAVFNEDAFDPELFLNDTQLMLNLIGNGIYSKNDFANDQVLKKLCEELRCEPLTLDSSGNVILTDVLEELKKYGLVTIVRSVYTFKHVARIDAIDTDGKTIKILKNEYIIRKEIVN
uniref:hypothetical protein n=1 Tax=Flavobacterium sp. TaxID=239 RepID=UPI004049B7D2